MLLARIKKPHPNEVSRGARRRRKIRIIDRTSLGNLRERCPRDPHTYIRNGFGQVLILRPIFSYFLTFGRQSRSVGPISAVFEAIGTPRTAPDAPDAPEYPRSTPQIPLAVEGHRDFATNICVLAL